MLQFQVFQTLVRRWAVRTFGQVVADNRPERNHRFLEEALELVQSNGVTQHQAHALVEYVYGRTVGRPQQEVGGTLLTLAALCAAYDWDMSTCATAELTRVNRPDIVAKIQQKQAAKVHDGGSPLPGITQDEVSIPIDGHLQRLTSGQASPIHLPRWREMVQKEGYTHDCGEWMHAGRCQLCDREMSAPLREQPGGGKLPRQHTDAVGTDGCKATVSKLI